MMTTITDMGGLRHYLHPDAIARVAQAGPSWRKIGAYVKTFDGKTIVAQESAEDIQIAVQAALRPPHSAIEQIEAFVANNAVAISYQSLGEYRSKLLRLLNEVKVNE
ncbi:hypothetical protein [Alcaligenes aquatilis]|uniref:Uncharacterized protein n=1 Tax=Alcaligenes aquatilis TaxID=323284 RepID=A0A3G2HY04_9BURK|nr:hypothetical protein [Alcaligenes aquatilis]AYN21628.1 hypothetical protein D3M96_14460 [Alcaligenes aquatilis]